MCRFGLLRADTPGRATHFFPSLVQIIKGHIEAAQDQTAEPVALAQDAQPEVSGSNLTALEPQRLS